MGGECLVYYISDLDLPILTWFGIKFYFLPSGTCIQLEARSSQIYHSLKMLITDIAKSLNSNKKATERTQYLEEKT